MRAHAYNRWFVRSLKKINMASTPDNISMAVFCDFENVALGVRDANYEKFDIKPVLERLLLKGSIVVKKAYCDWERYKGFKATMHEANFELIEIPHVRQSGKNSADIRLVVDALDLCYTKSHVNTFVIISGDSDFSPLVSKLRENAKQVIGVGVKQSTSDLLVANCDEFIFYDDLVRESRRAAAKRDPRAAQSGTRRTPEEERRRKEEMEVRKHQALELAVETFDALVSERGDSGKIWASVLKEAIKRRKPDFSESYYGFRTFGNLLEEAQTRGLLEFGRDEKSGAYVYRSSGLVAVPAAVNADAASETIASGEAGATAEEGNSREGGSRRDSRRNGRGGRKQNEQRRGESAPQAFVPVAEAESAVIEQYAPAQQPKVLHEVAEAVAEVVADGNAKRGSRRNGRGGRKNGDGAREARAEVVEVVEVAPAPEPVPEPVAEVMLEAVAEAKTKAKPRTPARKTAAAKKPAKKAVEAVVEVIEPAPVEVAPVVEDKPAKAPRKTPARRPARKKAEAA